MTDGYYNGAGLNISQAVHSELRSHQVAYDGSDIERAAMSGAAARQDALDEYQKMQDYQSGADAMRQLRESASRHTERLKQALQAAPGTRESVLRQDGQLDDSKMEELYLRAQDEVEKIKPKFWSPARQARYEQEFSDWESENRTRVEGLVHQYRAAGIRRAGAAALEEAEKVGDARGYAVELANQVDAGLLMESEARVKMLEFNERAHAKMQDEGYKMLMNEAVNDPTGVMLRMGRGQYADMDAVRMERVYAMAQRVAAMRAEQEDFSEQEKHAIAQGQVVKPRFKVRNGATEQEYKWREHYNREGTYGKFAGEIRAAFDEEVAACPVPQDEEEAEMWVGYMVKKWSDPQTGYGLDEYTVRLRCRQQAQTWLGAVEQEGQMRFSTDAFLKSLTDEQIAPWAAGMAAYRKAEFEDDAELNAEAATLLGDRKSAILHDVRNAMARWSAGNPKASYSQAYEKCMGYLLTYSEQHDTEIDMNVAYSWDDADAEEKFESAARDSAENQRVRIEADGAATAFTEQSGASGKETQWRRYAEYQAKQRPVVVQERSKADMERLYSVGKEQADEEVLFVTQEQYDKLVKKFGENPMAHVTLPGSRAYLPVPVRVGEVDGFALSDVAMVRLNNTHAKRASIRFAAGEKKDKKKEDDALPPDVPDDGLVPLDQNELFPEE
ncbi:MAG: hypothetical protein IIV41_06750 [Akkermansia sp.]|nr:hypothetical protein [Akkermansia sp.]